MWRVLRIFKYYAFTSPQQARIFKFGTNTCSYNKECEDSADIFGTLDECGLNEVESILKTAATKYPINSSLNKIVKSDVEQKKNTNDSYKYSSSYQFQNLHKSEEIIERSSSNIRDIVSAGTKKYLLLKDKRSKVKKLDQAVHLQKQDTSTKLEIFDHDGNSTEMSKDDFSFRSKSVEQFTPFVYHRKMELLIGKKLNEEALAVFEKEMVTANVRPDIRCYDMVIGIYAHRGYTKKAFSLFNNLRKDGIHISRKSVTSLFNACANSPYPVEDGLPRAIQFRKLLEHYGYHLNNSNYCAMMKAFGRAGDTATAFGIIDEMVYKGLNIVTTNINFLLQACISNKETGFRHALMLWKTMRELKLTPDIYSYNLLLRVTRDCKAGDKELFNDLTEEPSMSTANVDSNSGSDMIAIGSKSDKYVPIPEFPDLLAGSALPSDIFGVTSLYKGTERFALLGGIMNLLKNMYRDKVMPTANTFAMLLLLVPENTESEELVFQYMNKLNIKPDITSVNQLLQKRCQRNDYSGALEATDLIQKYELQPNHITYHNLALTCKSSCTVNTLLTEMKNADIRLTKQIVNILLRTCVEKSFYIDVLKILRHADARNIKPDISTIHLLETARNKIRNSLILEERETNERVRLPDEERKFLIEYSKWLKNTKLYKPKHPWEKYGYDGVISEPIVTAKTVRATVAGKM